MRPTRPGPAAGRRRPCNCAHPPNLFGGSRRPTLGGGFFVFIRFAATRAPARGALPSLALGSRRNSFWTTPMTPTPSEQSVSVWMRSAPAPEFPPLDADAEADVCVVGAGIAGLTTAYLLAKAGKSVVVLDDGPV